MTSQKVDCEHQWNTCVSQRMIIPIFNWKQITMDFVVGLPTIVGSYDTIFIDVKRLTKSAYFIPVCIEVHSGDIFLALYNSN